MNPNEKNQQTMATKSQLPLQGTSGVVASTSAASASDQTQNQHLFHTYYQVKNI